MQMFDANPMARQMMDTNPQLRQMMQNPQFVRQLTDPQNIQAMMQMQQALQQLQRGTGGGGGGGGGGSGGLFKYVLLSSLHPSFLFIIALHVSPHKYNTQLTLKQFPWRSRRSYRSASRSSRNRRGYRSRRDGLGKHVWLVWHAWHGHGHGHGDGRADTRTTLSISSTPWGTISRAAAATARDGLHGSTGQRAGFAGNQWICAGRHWTTPQLVTSATLYISKILWHRCTISFFVLFIENICLELLLFAGWVRGVDKNYICSSFFL